MERYKQAGTTPAQPSLSQLSAVEVPKCRLTQWDPCPGNPVWSQLWAGEVPKSRLTQGLYVNAQRHWAFGCWDIPLAGNSVRSRLLAVEVSISRLIQGHYMNAFKQFGMVKSGQIHARPTQSCPNSRLVRFPNPSLHRVIK